MIKLSAGFCLLWEHQNADHSPYTVGDTQDKAAEQSHHAGAQDMLMPSGQISEKRERHSHCACELRAAVFICTRLTQSQSKCNSSIDEEGILRNSDGAAR